MTAPSTSMVRIVLVDPCETARRALRGILACGQHQFACVSTAGEAWDFLRENVATDLVFTELKLAGDTNGLDLIQRLKSDPVLKLLPVVLYTAVGDRASVRRALELRVRNFLVKPYHDDDVNAEIAKCEADCWRDRFFEEERSFCRMMGYTAEQVHGLLDAVRRDTLAALENPAGFAHTLPPLIAQAETAGAWGMVESLNLLLDSALTARPAAIESVRLAAHLIEHRLDDSIGAKGFAPQVNPLSEAEQRERTRWQTSRVPVVDWSILRQQIDKLPGCPVINSSAASFQMMANGDPSCIHPLMDLVDRDPGLATQMLIAANQAHPASADENIIEDPRLAVGLLGEHRLESQARRLILAEERHLQALPELDWPQFWMFQTAVSRIAGYTARYLEFYSMESQARTAGLLHDVGKLVLLHLHPMGFQEIVSYAHRLHVPLAEAELHFLGTTTRDIGACLCSRLQLSPHYLSVLRWLGSPSSAGDDACLAAIVSLARDLCLHNGVGCSGEPVLDNPLPLEETAEWAVLRERLFPSFNLRRFELQVHACCQELRLEFGGSPFRTANLK